VRKTCTDIKTIFLALKQSLEEHAHTLRYGKLFLPQGLKRKKFTKEAFPKVINTFSSKLKLEVESEVSNPMPDGYNLNPQKVDYVFTDDNHNSIFFELESLDRSQIYLFRDYNGIDEDWDDNKLRYYKGTIESRIEKNLPLPRYYISFLVLPDQAVESYTIWDCDKHYNFLHNSLKQVIFQNPYRFYNGVIKSSARLWLNGNLNYLKKSLKEFQSRCELVIITCTIDKLILSRGKDGFDPDRELIKTINWK